ncbi:MAG: LapA family protein [Desulfobacteraceae bacterium]|nr:LapA family protein [Desulfobacteraceae bacterium]
MKKLKYALWLVVIGLVALAVYQNRDFFFESKSLGINLGFDEYNTPELPAGVYYLAVFLLGLLTSYISALPGKFRARKTIRQLNEKIADSEKKISRLETESAVVAGTNQDRAGPKEPGERQDLQEPQDAEASKEPAASGHEKSGE